MTSKNSFLISMRENLKRRMWAIAIFAITMLFAYPVKLAMILSNEAGYVSLMNMKKNSISYTGFDGATALLLTIGAIVSAIQGFSYLYHRKKVDMYVSEPVDAKRRFFVIYINGVLVYFVPYLIAQLCSVAVAGTFQATSTVLITNMFLSIFLGLIYYLAIYNIAILAVMLTGQIIVTVMAAGVFLGYEFAVRNMIDSLYYLFFNSYVNRSLNENQMIRYYFSPVAKAMEMVAKTQEIWDIKMISMQTAWDGIMKDQLSMAGVLLVQAIVAGIIAYICYRKRPLEASGKAMAFEKTKAPVKICIITLTSLVGSAWFYTLTNKKIGFAVLGLISGLVMGQFVMEIIYEFDLKALLKHKISFGISAVIATVVFLIFAMDVFRYDEFIPAKEEVESAAIQICFDNYYMYNNIDERYEVAWDYYSVLKNMEITDIDAVLTLAGAGMGLDFGDSYDENYYITIVCYRMKNGNVIYRRFPVFYDQQEEVLNSLFADTAYKEGNSLIYKDYMQDFFATCKVEYSDGMNNRSVQDQNAVKIMEAYKKDYMEMSYSDVRGAVPCGIITLNYAKDGYDNSISYPVFETYTNTCAYLESKNIPLKLEIVPEAIASIRITNSDTSWQDDMEASGTAVAAEQAVVSEQAYDVLFPSATYKDQKQIAEIVKGLTLSSLRNWCYSSEMFYNPLGVEITAANNELGYQYNWYSTGVEMLTSEVPDFVAQDIKYNPKK